MKPFIIAFIIMFNGALVAPTPVPSDAEIAARVLSEINEARVANGLAPYKLNPLLTQAATAHSQYMMETGEVEHTGPGGSTSLERVGATGYPYLRVNENIFAGMRSPEEAVEWWLTADELHRRNVLHPDMREAGIGVVTNAAGWTYYTLDISSQPNVLPMFINSDNFATTFPNVVLTLTNETIFVGGAGRIGMVAQVMVSNSPNFAGATVMTWAPYVNWALDVTTGAGTKTVYIRYVDAAGRTADSQDSIVFDPHGSISGTSTAMATATSTETATATPTDTAVPTATARIIEIVTEAATDRPSDTPTPEPTLIAEVIATLPEATSAPIIAATEPGSSVQTLRPLFAGILLTGIIAIIAGIFALMRGLRV